MSRNMTARLVAGAALTVGLLAGLNAASANDSAMKAAADPNQWGMYSKGYDNTRFSPLNQINANNAKKLKPRLFLLAGVAALQRILAAGDRRHDVRDDLLGSEIRLRAGRRDRRAQMDL